ncbi:MAG: DNA polymerase III subunit alpha [Firmicutes bacterium]|nr:DNA polymerase III subunit alpha [Bacillota bacterium]
MTHGSPFVHLHCHSPYSFLDGASRIRTLVRRAAELGQPALALTDRDNLCGAVEFVEEAERAGIRPILGAEVTLEPLADAGGGAGAKAGAREGAGVKARARTGARTEAKAAADPGYPLVLLAAGPHGYRQLSRLITRAHLERPRGRPRASLTALEEAAGASRGELLALTGGRASEIPARLLAGDLDGARAALERLVGILGRPQVAVELVNPFFPGGRRLLRLLAELAERAGVALVAANDVRYADRSAYMVHDLLCCVRAGVDVSTPHPWRPLNAEQDLKSAEAMAAAFAPYVEAVAEAGRWAERCGPALELGVDRHPEFPLPEGVDANEYLRRLVYEGARRRYGRVGPAERERLEHELDIIARLGFAGYFLLVWDVAQFAARRGIRFAGRGSAADSAVAYCLGITNVDAIRRGLLFERFLSVERAEKPDIDIDFDARRRDEVTAYVYERYGRRHVANVAAFQTFRGRSALRDLGKALRLPAEEIDRFAKRVPYFVAADNLAEAFDKVPELRESGLDQRKFGLLLQAAAAVAGFPRHLSTHVGGVVITREPVEEILPVQMAAKGVPILQADRDGVEALGLVKLDLLSLRTFSAVEQAVRAIVEEDEDFDYDRIPQGDRATFEMLNEGRTIGVFQLESPAQRALQARLGAERFEDIVASVAIIRPGPIKGNMVEPYIRRRRGEEPVRYLHPALEPILRKTYGVVLFQEQVIDIAHAVAGFTPGEADRLRRTMSHARSQEEMAEIGRLFVRKAAARGVPEETAAAIFQCLAGYASYGFNEAHAAAFADTAYRTAYLVRHHPAAFFAGILSSQPMGYYPLHTVVADARARGVEVRPPDVRSSLPECTVEDGGTAIRLGLALLAGLSRRTQERIAMARAERPYAGVLDFLARAAPSRDEAEALALSGALDGLVQGRRRALLWALPEAYRRLEARAALPIEEAARAAGAAAAGTAGNAAAGTAVAAAAEVGDPPDLLPALPEFTPEERVVHEWRCLGFALTAHPMAFWRERLRRRGFLTSREAAQAAAGSRVRVAGLPVRPHRPPTRSGRIVVYVSLEDEFGLTDVVILEELYQREGGVLFGERLPPVAVEGVVERRGRGVQVRAERVAPLGRTRGAGAAGRVPARPAPGRRR